MLFYTRKNMGTLAAALSRWSTYVQQRKAQVRITIMSDSPQPHCQECTLHHRGPAEFAPFLSSILFCCRRSVLQWRVVFARTACSVLPLLPGGVAITVRDLWR